MKGSVWALLLLGISRGVVGESCSVSEDTALGNTGYKSIQGVNRFGCCNACANAQHCKSAVLTPGGECHLHDYNDNSSPHKVQGYTLLVKHAPPPPPPPPPPRPSPRPSPRPAPRPSPSPPAPSANCLCIFDVDRTLTGAQNSSQIGKCGQNKKFSDVYDPAYGGGPLMLSEGMLNMGKTFCSRCHIGIISKGNAGGTNSGMRQVLQDHLNLNGKRNAETRVPDGWSKYDANDKVKSGVNHRLVYGVPDDRKHWVATKILDWFKDEKGINLDWSNAYFFDDRADNVDTFLNHAEQANQVSCKSRDNSPLYNNTIGYCGMTSAEITQRNGVNQCGRSALAGAGSSETITVV